MDPNGEFRRKKMTISFRFLSKQTFLVGTKKTHKEKLLRILLGYSIQLYNDRSGR